MPEPNWKRVLRDRLRDVAGSEVDIEHIVDELSQHLADRYQEILADGESQSAAERRALDELAGPGVLGRAIQTVGIPPTRLTSPLGEPSPRSGLLSGLRADIRDGLRALRGSPIVTTVAVVTLSLGIAANTAIFSVVNSALLKPLPFGEPDRLVAFWGSAPEMGIPVVSFPDALYLYLQSRTQTLISVGAYAPFTATLTDPVAEPERISGAVVTAAFFTTLRRSAAQGRTISSQDEVRGQPPVAVLSDAFWRRRFGADPAIIGRAVTLDRREVQVIGVMPAGLDFPDRAQLWMPLQLDAASLDCWCYSTVGRLAPGRQPADAAREVALLTDAFWAEREAKPAPTSTEPKAVVRAQTLSVFLNGDVRRPLLVVFGAVGIVLAIACANIATLLLARATARRRELALRCCLGASPWRIVRQLLVESTLLATIGAGVGLVLAHQGTRVLATHIMEQLSYVQSVSVDFRVLAFTLLMTAAAVIAFGIAPAVRAANVDLQDAVRDGGRTTRGFSSRWWADAFVIAQFALSVVLLVGAGLLLRTMANIKAVDAGFRPDNVLVGRVSLPRTPGPREQSASRARQIFDEMALRLRAIPGVHMAGMTSIAPFSEGSQGQPFVVRGLEPVKGQPSLVTQIRVVTPGYFDAIGTPVLRGRAVLESDRPPSPPVVLVNEALARQFWADGNAIGQELRLGDNGPWRTVVGVVANAKHGDLLAEAERYVYIPHAQQPSLEMDVVVRAAIEPPALASAIRGVVRELDRSVPLYNVHTLEGAVQQSLVTRRVTNNLLAGFAAAALLLAVVGIYGLMAINVSRRIHEFGIRLALGASRADVFRLVLRQAMTIIAAGVVLGLGVALWVSRYAESLLYDVQPRDPLVLTLVISLLSAIGLAASFVPAVRATATSPLEALRGQ